MSWSLGPLDRVIYTPAAHRIHHSAKRDEADRNYGGFFVLFDRIFGSFVATEPCDRPERYGLPSGRDPRTARAALFDELRDFVQGFKAVRGAVAKLRYTLIRPQ